MELSEDTFWEVFNAHTPRWYSRMIHTAAGCDFDQMMQDLRLRVWRAYARHQFQSTGQIVNYGEVALRHVTIDALRHNKSGRVIVPIDMAINASGPDTPERSASQAAWRAQFWDVLRPHLRDARERIAIGTLAVEHTNAYSSKIGTGYFRASQVAAEWPHLFADATDVSNVRRYVLGRIRRNKDTLSLLSKLREEIA
jgi:DNA-directed RNA polymerase specialized sigma24 family protein